MKLDSQIQSIESSLSNQPICTECACFCHDLGWNPDKGWQYSEKCNILPNFQLIPSEVSLVDDALHIIQKEFQDAFRYNRRIAFTGLEHLSLESQRAALALASQLHAWVLAGDGDLSADPWDLTFAQLGGWYASWSEIRRRSDGILLWYSPLWQSHPRWLERFGPRSHHAHQLAVISPDTSVIDSGFIEEQLIRIDPSQTISFLTDLRLTLKNNDQNPVDEKIRRVIHLFHQSHWLSIIRSADPAGIMDRSTLAHSFHRLVMESNTSNHRVVVTNIPNTINSTGLHAALSWRAGLPLPLYFSPEGPVFRPDEMKAEDFELVVAFGPLSTEFIAAKTIHFNHETDSTSDSSQMIEIPVAKPGVDCEGTLIRPDGVAIRVRPLLKSKRPNVLHLLDSMLDKLSSESDFRRTDS